MTDTSRQTSLESDEAVEALLGQARPRLVPPEDEARAVRQAVHAEWRKVTGRQQSRKRLMSFAMAASVLVAVFVSLNMLRINGVDEVAVASIDKSFGSIYVLGENSEHLEGNHLNTVVGGQTLITDTSSGIGLAWGNGGSLRIDENTRVRFVSDETVYLESGRVYFDSAPVLADRSVTGSDVRLTIDTDHGEVMHVGTQYMARADATGLTVSVREGEVVIEGAGRSGKAAEGQQLAISGSGAHSLVNIRPHGSAWEWVEQTSPSATVDGRSVDEFLGWVSHETGLELEYESQDAEDYARQEALKGTVDLGPRQALRVWMSGVDLEWRIDDGVIYVDEAR